MPRGRLDITLEAFLGGQLLQQRLKRYAFHLLAGRH